MMIGSTKDGGEGVVGGHAYSLIGVYEVGDHPALLKVRNPWGHKEGTGEYCDTAEVW